MGTREASAAKLAELHYEVEPEMEGIYRLVAPHESATDPIRLLEVNAATVATGIIPLRFAPRPAWDIHHPSVIVEVTPAEFADIQASRLPLPNGWAVGERYDRPRPGTANGHP